VGADGKVKKGPGRPAGVPNRTTTVIRDLITGALDKAGGMDYLVKQAEQNPVAFMALVGKVLPLQVTGANGGPLEFVGVLADRLAEARKRLELVERLD